MINFNEAMKKIIGQFNDFEISSCVEHNEMFVFSLSPKNNKNAIVNALYSVDKKDGKIEQINPLDVSSKCYNSCKILFSRGGLHYEHSTWK